MLGRRGVIFCFCLIVGASSIWEAFTYSWPQLFVSRLALGLGVGPMVRPPLLLHLPSPACLPFTNDFYLFKFQSKYLVSYGTYLHWSVSLKSSPRYLCRLLVFSLSCSPPLVLVAECSPAPIRGALVMQWQIVRRPPFCKWIKHDLIYQMLPSLVDDHSGRRVSFISITPLARLSHS
jgi:MFS family permease